MPCRLSLLTAIASSLVGATSARALAADEPAAVAARVDALLAGEVQKSGPTDPQPVGRADDETFLRRVSFDLIGRLPSPGEVAAFSFDPSPTKRTDLVERLLANSEYGENWGRYWRDVIMYRRTEERALIAADSLQKHLAAEFNRGAGWDEIARKFVTATGDIREEGSTALIAAQMGDTAEIAAETSRVFLGIQIQCAQCHDHKFDRWQRTQFHELAAFFPRVEVRNVKGVQRSFEVVGVDQARGGAKKNNRARASKEHYMPDLEDPQAQGTLMQPVFFVTGEQLPLGVPDAKRRQTLAEWITDDSNPWFAKAFVNRMWSELVGEGFYEPVDDIGPDRDCLAPQTLDYLAQQFVASGHDVKALLRTIVATEAYQRESRSRRGLKDQPFLASCPQKLRGDQLFDALLVALDIDEQVAGGGRRMGGGAGYALRTPRGRFNETFGYDPSISREEVAGSIPQALMLMNGPEINRPINGKPSAPAGLSKLLAANPDNKAVIVDLYLRSLAREPSADEVKTCMLHVKQSKSRAEGFEDVLWALVNSTEFLHRR